MQNKFSGLFLKKLASTSVLCAVAHAALGGEWTFADGKVNDGTWTLRADFNSSAKTLTIKGCDSGSGVLNLDDPVVNGVAVEKVYFWNQIFEHDKVEITEFHCNRFWQPDANNMTWALLRYNRFLTKFSVGGPNAVWLWSDTVCGCSNLVSIVLDLPNQTNITASAIAKTPKLESIVIRSSKRMALPPDLLKDRKFLKSATLDLPKNTEIPDGLFSGCSALTDLDMRMGGDSVGNYAFDDCRSLALKIAELCPPSVTKVGSCAFQNCLALSGDLVLTNLQHMGDAAYAYTKLQNVMLCGPVTLDDWKNTRWGNNGVRFTGCTSLTNIVFDLPNLPALYQNDFNNCWALRSVYFYRKPFDATSLRYLLNGKGLSPKTCTLFVSPQQWPASEREASGCRALTEAEKADARKPARCLGMCDVGDPSVPEGDGQWTQQRLAWFARWQSPYDVPQGLAVFIR